jgi:hypothetical protein
LPSGDGAGSPTRFNAIMSSNVNGCFASDAGCAKTETTSARKSGIRNFFCIGQIGGLEVPVKAQLAQPIAGYEKTHSANPELRYSARA